MSSIAIAQADVKVKLEGKRIIYTWIKSVIISEKRQPGHVSIVLCSDGFLLDMNKKFLHHDYYTDIITFDYTVGNTISGELYISVDRVKDNAKRFKSSFEEELHRVMIHGVLHLCGYNDKSPVDRRKMRVMEDKKLQMLKI